jgi:hypothetical protein
VRRGSSPKALKRRKTVSEEKVLCSNSLTIRFDQLEDNRVNWYIEPDEIIRDTQALSLIELAECNAPLAAMGIRALWKMCVDGLVYHSLEQANDIQIEIGRRMANGMLNAEPVLLTGNRTLN